jgi:hypothetical protein
MRRMHFIHASWAVGAACGAMSAGLTTRSGGGRSAWVGIALIFGAVAITSRWRRNEWKIILPHVTIAADNSRHLNQMVTYATLGAAFLGVGLECAVGQWALVRVYSEADLHSLAGPSIALYWSTFAAGRVQLAAVSHRVRSANLLSVSSLTTCSGAMCFWLLPGWTAPLFGLPLMGLGLSVFLPLLLTVTPHLTNVRSQRMAGYQNTAGAAGGAALAGETGFVMQVLGVASLNLWLLCLALSMVSCVVIARTGSRGLVRPQVDQYGMVRA